MLEKRRFFQAGVEIAAILADFRWSRHEKFA